MGVGGQPHTLAVSTPGKKPAPNLKEAGWAPGQDWKGEKSRPNRDSISERPSRSQSLYVLSYPVHVWKR